MKKFIVIILFCLCVLFIYKAFAGTTSLTSYYPPPRGDYNKVVLANNYTSSTVTAPSQCVDNTTIFVDSTGTIQKCTGFGTSTSYCSNSTTGTILTDSKGTLHVCIQDPKTGVSQSAVYPQECYNYFCSYDNTLASSCNIHSNPCKAGFSANYIDSSKNAYDCFNTSSTTTVVSYVCCSGTPSSYAVLVFPGNPAESCAGGSSSSGSSSSGSNGASSGGSGGGSSGSSGSGAGSSSGSGGGSSGSSGSSGSHGASSGGSSGGSSGSSGSWAGSSGSSGFASSGSGGGSGCFIIGTKVLLANGKSIAIEKVKAGDILLGSNGSHNKVLQLQIHPRGSYTLYGFNGGKYFVTANHPLMTTDGWKAIDPVAAMHTVVGQVAKIGQLKVGDTLITRKGLLRIKSIRSKLIKNTSIYNTALDGDHDYYSNGFLVHNGMSQYNSN